MLCQSAEKSLHRISVGGTFIFSFGREYDFTFCVLDVYFKVLESY